MRLSKYVAVLGWTSLFAFAWLDMFKADPVLSAASVNTKIFWFAFFLIITVVASVNQIETEQKDEQRS